MVGIGLLVAIWVLDADFRRRKILANAYTIVTVLAIAGLFDSKLYHLLERPTEFFADPIGMFFTRSGFAWFGGLLGGFIALWFLARHYKLGFLTLLDAASPAGALGYGFGRLGCLLSGDGDYGIPTTLPWGMSFPHGLVPTTAHVHPTPIYEFLGSVLIFWLLWRMGGRITRKPRPEGEVVAAYFIFTGLARFLVEFIRINPRVLWGLSNAQVMSLVCVIGGIVLMVVVRRHFKAISPERRILRHAAAQGDAVQPEYHRPTPECLHPERWRMYDSLTAEVEVLEFLKTLVTTLKPNLIVETGTFMGISTIAMAEGCAANGFGKIITIEKDPEVFAGAKKRIQESGHSRWIECRHASSLETKISGTIDLLFSDSEGEIRIQEVRRFLPQMNPNGIILIHDASSHFGHIRKAALDLEREGLLSVLLLPTPRGLVMAQPRTDRR